MLSTFEGALEAAGMVGSVAEAEAEERLPPSGDACGHAAQQAEAQH